ncbi:MAG: heavy metal translocating P-type ATPase [Zymomonas mobilis]|uniref:heavy metal translocating P-type ATPase n=1 Tax=Zymomonas mobilis TaxID=542 RepID=UPI0039E8566E
MASKKTVSLFIKGMECAACSSRIEKRLNRLPDVEASVNFATEKAQVTFDPSVTQISDIIKIIEKIGYGAIESEKIDSEKQRLLEQKLRKQTLYYFLLALFCSLPFLLQMVMMFFPNHSMAKTESEMPRLIQWGLATIVEFIAGASFFKAAWKSLRSGSANMDVLVVLGTGMAYLYSSIVTFGGFRHLHIYFEASAMIITLVLLGRLLEDMAKNRAGSAMHSLLSLQPPIGHIEEDGHISDVVVSQIQAGNILVIRSGERVPVDGQIVAGESSFDEAMLTGEAMPVVKQAGDTVFAASINKGGAVRIKAIAVGAHTALAGIIRMVEEAQGSKAPIQKLADKIAGIFVPVVIVIAFLTLAVSWLLTGSFPSALVSAVSTLVIACPCSLGLAVPTAIMVGTGAGAKKGILIRNVDALERAKNINYLVVDKTGTITEGKPEVATVACSAGIKEEDLLTVATSLASQSSHPLSQAIASFGRDKDITIFLPDHILEKAGLGVTGTDKNHHKIRMGSLRFLEESGIKIQDSALSQLHQDEQKKESSFVYIARDNQYLGSIALADPVRPTSKKAVERLYDLGIEVAMLTGDNDITAQKIAENVGIRHYKAGLLPEDKANEIQSLKKQGHYVGMVGDGINDAPALAVADVSFAIGAGSDIAIESADIILMKSNLEEVALAISLSRATMQKMKQNLFFAFIYNVLGIPLAAFGFLNPVIAGAAMAMSSVSVVSNSLLLSRWSAFPSGEIK